MAGKNTAVFGIYRDEASLRIGVDALEQEGFRLTDLSVLFPSNVGTKDFAHEKGTKAPEGATTGGVAGGVTGGVLGWLAGAGTIAIPGIGPFIAAGPARGTFPPVANRGRITRRATNRCRVVFS